MLRRIATALVLFAAVAALLAAGRLAWAAGTALVLLLGSGEWGRLCGLSGRARWGYLSTTAALCVAAILAHPAQWVFWQRAGIFAAAGFWVLLIPAWLARQWRPRPPLAAALLGWLLLFPTWFALIGLRDAGIVWLLLPLGAIWLSDIFAYFGGRLFGRTKLAIHISPKKTWEGLACGLLAVIAFALSLVALGYTPPRIQPVWYLVPWLLLVAVMAALGDLFESMIKRQAGVKDSGQLLPGHGGVLDRIDAIIAGLPVAAAIGYAAGWLT
jgi:phosphatidate cytidylyltransferase